MYVLLAIFIEIFVLFLIRNTFGIDSVDGIILVLINTIIFLIWSATNKKLSNFQKIVMMGGYLLRLILLAIDQYIVKLPYNNSDAEGFQSVAVTISNNISLVKENLYGGIFTKILGILYYLIGENRIFAQSINILLGMAAIYNFDVIVNQIEINRVRKTKFFQLLANFLPQTLILSVVLLREIVVVYLVILSLRSCIAYTKTGNKLEAIKTLIAITFASAFHAGVIFLIIGYILLISFYNVKEKRMRFSTKKVTIFIFIILIFGVIYLRYGDIFATKLTNMDEEKLLNSFEGESKGGSAYLGGKNIESFSDMIIYTIPKALYFLFSPMPWDWRGINDLTSFTIDSLFYAYLIYNILKYRKNIKKEDKSIINCLLIGLIITIIAFSVGTSNAGTAIRHRHKIFLYLNVMAIYCINGKKEEEKRYEKRKFY